MSETLTYFSRNINHANMGNVLRKHVYNIYQRHTATLEHVDFIRDRGNGIPGPSLAKGQSEVMSERERGNAYCITGKINKSHILHALRVRERPLLYRHSEDADEQESFPPFSLLWWCGLIIQVQSRHKHGGVG